MCESEKRTLIIPSYLGKNSTKIILSKIFKENFL